MESRFGYDFSQVRVHTDATAARSARDVDAKAYTVGNHLVFDSGLFNPESVAGRRLLAHELTHVVQQQSASRAPLGPDAVRLLQRAPEQSALKPEKPATKLSSGELVDQALSRLDDPEMVWLRVHTPPVNALWIQLIQDATSSNDAQEDKLHDRADRLNAILQEVAPAVLALHQLSDPEKFLPSVADVIVNEVFSIVGKFAAAIVSTYSDLLIERDLLKNADTELAALPEFIANQYLGPNGYELQLKEVKRAIFNIGELRGAAGRPAIARASNDPVNQPQLDDILQLTFPSTKRAALPFDRVIQQARNSKGSGRESSLAFVAITAGMYGNLAKAGLLYEQFAYWSHLLDSHPVLDHFPPRKPDCDAIVKKLDGIIGNLETGWWIIGDVFATFGTGVSQLEQLLADSSFNQALTDVPARLETIDTVNRIATVIAITAGAALFAGAAAGGVAAALDTAGASTLVVGTAEFGTEALAFTAASRLGQQIAFGKVEGSFAGDLLTNTLMLGVLKVATLGFTGAFKVLADPKIYKASYALGKAGTGLATLQIFGEAQHAILTGKAMNGEERYRSIVQNVITLGALEAAGFITKPIQERIGTDLAKAFGLDKRFATELGDLQKKQTGLSATFEALKRSGAPDPKSVQDLIQGMQELWAKELDLLKRGRQRHAITPDQYDTAIQTYASAGGRMQLQLANLGLDLPGGAEDLSFRRVGNGVVSYTPGSEGIIENFFKDKGGKLERNPQGTLQGRLPSGEITFYIPAGESPRQIPSKERIATARDEAESAAVSDPLARAGLDRLQELMGARKADAVLAGAHDVNALLRALADPAFQKTLGSSFYESLATSPAIIDFARTYGAELVDSIYRTNGRNFGTLPDALKRASERLDSAPTAEARKLLHDQILAANRKQLATLLGTPVSATPKTPKMTKATLGVNRSAANWKVFRGEAEKFATLHDEKLTDAQIDARADMEQIHEWARQKKYDSFSHANRRAILDRFDELAKDTNLAQATANQMRGDLAEALFNPEYGKKKEIFLGGIQQTANVKGSSIPDYKIVHPGFAERVELKSDLIDRGTQQKDGAFDSGVSAAQEYLKDVQADIGNLPVGDKISLDFIRDPGATTRRRMLELVFAEGSPVYRVRFGGGPWLEKSSIR